MYDQNLVIYGFQELKKVWGDENKDLYSKLLRLAVLQSGLTKSPISFTSLIPYEDFVNIYNNTLSDLENMPQLPTFKTLNVFERNNWHNDEVVNFVKSKMVSWVDWFTQWTTWGDANTFLDKRLNKAIKDETIPKLIGIDPFNAKSEFIVYTWQADISKQERIRRRKIADTSHIKKALMKRVYNADGTPLVFENLDKKTGKVYTKYIYKAINAWGDSFRAQEFYNGLVADPRSTIAQQSVLDNGFEKYNEVEDGVILALLDKQETTSPQNIDIGINTNFTQKDFKC